MITLLVLAACLLVVALLFGKRFGSPVLGMAAGSIMSNYLSTTIADVGAPYLRQYVTYVPVVIILLPALILLLFARGHHRTFVPRVFGSVVFAFAGLVFLLAAPSTPVSISGAFPFITDHIGVIVSGVLALAILEIIFGRPSKKPEEKGKK